MFAHCTKSVLIMLLDVCIQLLQITGSSHKYYIDFDVVVVVVFVVVFVVAHTRTCRRGQRIDMRQRRYTIE